MIFISILFLAFASIGISYATYERLSDRISQNNIMAERFQKRLLNSIDNNSETISLLSRQKVQPSAALESDPQNYTNIINQVNAQNKVISKLLEYHGTLREEIARLKRQGSSSGKLSTSAITDGSNGNTGNDNIVEQPVTIEDLEQEIDLANKQNIAMNHKTETVFQNQSREGMWAAQTNLEIGNVLEKIQVDTKFSGLGVNNIDCRESMCKVELSHRDIQQLEEFDLLFLLEVGGDQPITATSITKPLADGGISNTYYLSTN